MTEPLDPAALEELRRAAGEEAVHAVVQAFLGSAPSRLEQAAAAQAAGDGQACRDALHALASSAAMVGALEMARFCREGQHEDSAPRRQEILRRLDELWPAVREALRARLEADPA